jgi:hypothetical protein
VAWFFPLSFPTGRGCTLVIAINNTGFITKLDAFPRITHIGLMAPNPILGYSPADETFKIDKWGWNGATITIRQGVRVSPNFEPASAGGAILTVGDSFVFGDQVSDDETWPALLERGLNRRVVNGGVSGYGPVQGVLRAKQLLKVRDYSLVIFSVLVLRIFRGISGLRDMEISIGPRLFGRTGGFVLRPSRRAPVFSLRILLVLIHGFQKRFSGRI